METAKSNLVDSESKIRSEFRDQLEEERSKWDSRFEETERKHKVEVELLKEEYARSLAEAKGIPFVSLPSSSLSQSCK